MLSAELLKPELSTVQPAVDIVLQFRPLHSVGRDNAKNVDGRKRHIVVDSLGLLLAVLVTAASVDDAQAAQELFPRLEGQPMGRVVRMFADSKYHNFALYEWVEDHARWNQVNACRQDGSKGW